MANDQREDINDVLDDVIVKINRITDHLRCGGENEAANRFTRDMTETFRDLYNVIALWDLESCQMKADTRSLTPNTIDHLGTARPIPPSNTWASVAATEPVTDKNGVIKFRPNGAFKRTIEFAEAKLSQPDSRDRRVVWVRPWTESRPLRQISNEMRDLGAIYSIAFAPDEQAVCIIFQHAWCAADFMHKCTEYIGRKGVSQFGPGCEVSPGLPYPVNEGLRQMDNPYNERRRLTFARSQLFSNGISEKRFRQDIEDIVGPSNVELLWLFNTGNATVVFSAVPLAKMVKETFYRYSKSKKHMYEGVMVSYSHDPCERDLHLVSQIPGHANFIGSNGHGNDNGNNSHMPTRSNRSNTFSTNRSARTMSIGPEYFSATKRRSTISKSVTDEEGWQTVKKRR